MRVIHQERSEQEGLRSSVQTLQALIVEKEAMRNKQWISYQQDFLRQAPDVMRSDLYINNETIPLVRVDALDKKNVQEVEQELKEYIIKEVSHVEP